MCSFFLLFHQTQQIDLNQYLHHIQILQLSIFKFIYDNILIQEFILLVINNISDKQYFITFWFISFP